MLNTFTRLQTAEVTLKQTVILKDRKENYRPAFSPSAVCRDTIYLLDLTRMNYNALELEDLGSCECDPTAALAAVDLIPRVFLQQEHCTGTLSMCRGPVLNGG